MVKVTVPASTANIGPGFDTLGIALNIYNIYTFEMTGGGLVIEGCSDIYKNEGNLVYRAFMITAAKIGVMVKGLKISMDTNIPVSRGLGSSSACIVAGVFGANELLNGNFTKEELFKIAVEIEGHPDNIAPTVYGGLTASFMDEGIPYYAKYEINKKIKFCALIPDFETSTEKARKLLPKNIAFEDAVFNMSRAAVLLKALENGDSRLINKSLKDRLHQNYRKVLIDEYGEVEKICIDNNSIAFFVSGSGPTLMNIIQNIDFTNLINDDIMSLRNKWEIKLLQADENGVVIVNSEKSEKI